MCVREKGFPVQLLPHWQQKTQSESLGKERKCEAEKDEEEEAESLSLVSLRDDSALINVVLACNSSGTRDPISCSSRARFSLDNKRREM